MLESGFHTIACFLCFHHDFFREEPGSFDPGRIVKRGEGMKGSAGLSRFHPAGLPVGGVEHIDRANGPTPKGVEGPAVEIVSGGSRVVEISFLADGQGFPDFFGLVRIYGFSTYFRNEESGIGQGPVTENHGGHTEPSGPAD